MKNKKNILSSIISFFTFLLISCASSTIAMSYSTNNIDNVINAIRLNNKNSDFNYSYWKCEPIESRKNWLGWSIKSYLTSLSNPWAVYGDEYNNNSFLYTDYSLNQTFIKNPNNDELIPVSVFSSPSSRSLECFNIKLVDKKSTNVKYGFYCSFQLSKLINISDADLVVNCDGINTTKICFDGIVEKFDNQFIEKFSSRNQNYIIVPYMLNDSYIASYDMRNYTGQASFYSVLKGDIYENNYYINMIYTIYSLGGVKDQTCYRASFVDNYEDLLKPVNLIESKIQKDFLSNNFEYLNYICLSLSSLVILLIYFIYYILTFKKIIEQNILSLSLSMVFSLLIYYFLGEIFYISQFERIIFWNIKSRILVLAITIISFAIFSLFLNCCRKKRIKNINYIRMDI